MYWKIYLWMLAAAGAAPLFAQPNQSPGDVAATIGNDVVYVSEVDREVEKVVKGRDIQAQSRRILQAEALERLISRRLILRYLAKKKAAATDQEISLAIAQARDRLKQQALTLEEFLKRGGLSPQEFRRALEWQHGWKRYLEHFVTDKNIQLHFERNRKQFDGTQLRVSQILIKVKPADDQATWDAALAKAERIRGEITAKKTDFASAAKTHSDSPSGATGGDIGLISRHQPMPETFSRTAFDLDKNEISQPIKTSFGVHLIQCVEVLPGQKNWQDVRQKVETDLVRYLFDWVASRERPNAEVNYTGKSPRFKSGTRDLAN